MTFAYRYYFFSQADTYSSSDSYFALRQIESVKETNKVFFEDDLSFGGRRQFFMPTFYLLLGFLTKIFGEFIALRIIPNLIAGLVVFIVFSISKEITGNDGASLVSAFVAGFLPIFHYLTINSINGHAIIAPVFLLALNYLIKCAKSKKKFPHLIISSVFLIILSPFSFIFILSIWIYILLIKIDNKEAKKYIFEFALFTSLLWYSIYYFIFKEGAFKLSTNVFMMGIPTQLYTKYFTAFTLIRAFSGIGLIVVFLGIFGAWKAISKEEKVTMNFALGATFVVILIMAFLRFFRLSVALSYFGFIVIILASITLADIFVYTRKLKHEILRNILSSAIVIMTILFTVGSTFYESNLAVSNRVTDETLHAVEWLKNQPSGVVAGNYNEGNLISFYSNNANVMDTNFGWGLNTKDRINDLRKLYTNPFQTQALEVTDKYNIRYIIFSPETREMFGETELDYVENTDCFPLIYDDKIKIYEVKCNLG